MAGLLRLVIPAMPPSGWLGGREIVTSCIAVPLESVLARLVGRRDFLAEKSCLPPDSAVIPPRRLEGAMHRHRVYLAVAAAVIEVESALNRGDDIEREATLGYYHPPLLEGFSRRLIYSGEFVWAECSVCGTRYTPQECRISDWGWLASPKFGADGKYVDCPHGHLVFACMTSVS
jgi:hypothetical protein